MSLSLSPLAFLGAGRMASALIKGFLQSGLVLPQDITASSKSGNSSQLLARNYKILSASNNAEAIMAAPVIFLCTKPGQACETLSQNASFLKNKLVISVVAGISSEALFTAAGGEARIIRTMPNTGVRVGKGATTIAPHSSATAEDLQLTKRLFSSVGAAFQIEESHMDATTAVSGSGPAFALLFLESLMQGGVEAGLDKGLSRTLAAHALQAAAALVLETSETPEFLRAEIASPKGTTEAGLQVLEAADLLSSGKAAVLAAQQRSQELAQGK